METKPPREQFVNALRAFQRDLEEQLRLVTALIERLGTTSELNLSGLFPVSAIEVDERPVQTGQYRHMKMGAAMFAYLSERGSVSVPKMALDLTAGGVVTLVKQKTQGERLRRIRITIGNNAHRIEFDPATDTVRIKDKPQPNGKDKGQHATA